jgi:hypothetical protein
MSDPYGNKLKNMAPVPHIAKPIPNLKHGDKNWDTPCMNCECTPTVYPTDLCGPCCFGSAETAGGNW